MDALRIVLNEHKTDLMIESASLKQKLEKIELEMELTEKFCFDILWATHNQDRFANTEYQNGELWESYKKITATFPKYFDVDYTSFDDELKREKQIGFIAGLRAGMGLYDTIMHHTCEDCECDDKQCKHSITDEGIFLNISNPIMNFEMFLDS